MIESDSVAPAFADVIGALGAIDDVDRAVPADAVEMLDPPTRSSSARPPVAQRLPPPPFASRSTITASLHALVKTFMEGQDRPVHSTQQATAEARMIGVVAGILRLTRQVRTSRTTP